MRTFQPSMVIEDSDERPIAVVEVTRLSDMPLDDAIETRRSMLERGMPPHVPYLLLVSEDIGFLWKNDPSLNMDRLPDDKFPMHKVIVQYSIRPPEQRLDREEFEY